MLAYSSVGQMATIVLGITLGTPAALQGALLHMLNHAVMKGCLFLAVGGVQWRTGTRRLPTWRHEPAYAPDHGRVWGRGLVR